MSLSATPSAAPAPSMVSANEKKWIDTPPITGDLDIAKDDLGKLLGKGGQALKKFVTGKSAFKVKEAYARDKTADGVKTSPADLGPVFVNVKLDDSGEKISYSISIRNGKEDLSKYLGIVKTNLIRHASACCAVRPREDTFSHKIIFSTKVYHEGSIGKFIGSSGKNIRALASKLKDALGVPFVYVTMIPKGDDPEKKRPWENQIVAIPPGEECNFDVRIFVCANLPRDTVFADTIKNILPLITKSVSPSAGGSGGVETVSASDFIDGWSNFRPESPSYVPGTPDEGW